MGSMACYYCCCLTEYSSLTCFGWKQKCIEDKCYRNAFNDMFHYCKMLESGAMTPELLLQYQFAQTGVLTHWILCIVIPLVRI